VVVMVVVCGDGGDGGDGGGDGGDGVKMIGVSSNFFSTYTHFQFIMI